MFESHGKKLCRPHQPDSTSEDFDPCGEEAQEVLEVQLLLRYSSTSDRLEVNQTLLMWDLSHMFATFSDLLDVSQCGLDWPNHWRESTTTKMQKTSTKTPPEWDLNVNASKKSRRRIHSQRVRKLLAVSKGTLSNAHTLPGDTGLHPTLASWSRTILASLLLSWRSWGRIGRCVHTVWVTENVRWG